MVNWKEGDNFTFRKFTEEITKNWLDNGFDKKETGKWLEGGLQPNDSRFAQWLRDTKNKNVEWFSEYGDEEKLRKEFHKYSKNKDKINLVISSSQDSAATSERLLSESGSTHPKQKFDDWSDWHIKTIRRKQFLLYEKSEKELKERLSFAIHKNDRLAENLLKKELEQLDLAKENLEKELIQQWINAEIREWNDTSFTKWLQDIKDKDIEWFSEHGVKKQQAQKLLDQNCPTSEDKTNCQFLNFWVKNKNNPRGMPPNCLTGPLSLQGFANLKAFWCGGQVITSLDLTDCFILEELYCQDNQLTRLDLSSDSKLKKLGCSNNQLAELDVSNCANLEKFDCSANNLTNLDLTSCPQLTSLWCQENQLTQLTLPTKLPNLEQLICYDNLLTRLDFPALNETKLTILGLTSNNFPAQDLTNLVKFTSLKELYLGNTNQTKVKQGIINHWTGSLQPLQNMKQLQVLRISNTDLTDGTKYLPTSVMEINCSYSAKPNSKVKLISKKLEKSSDFVLVDFFNQIYLKKQLNPAILSQIQDWNHKQLTPEQEALLVNLIISEDWRNHYKENGLCQECQQLNSKFEWCRTCQVQYLQAEFPNWTSGNLEIDKFIQKCQLEATNDNQLLEWIPYEEFSNIKHLTDGGFGQVYKAEWIERNNWPVALKSLTNSQKLTSEFLSEVINTKLVDGSSTSLVVRCYGISQDPNTKNYLMVMDYMPEGNLRQYLNKNYSKLKFADKFRQLVCITQGLVSIHRANLIHKDFHSGNVLSRLQNKRVVSLISDLGLSRPVNEIDSEKIYGVLPYVAPEVLRGGKYTPATDIYSFGMVAYELLSGLPPYYDITYDNNLAWRICQGLRPNLEVVIAPQLLKDLIGQCWDAEPEQRPITDELHRILSGWLNTDFSIKKNTDFYQQYQALLPKIDSPIKPLFNHSADKYTSKPINTEQINELLRNLPKTENLITEQIKEIEKELEEFKKSLDSELVELVEKFIEVSKKLARNKDDEETIKGIEKLHETLEEKSFSEKDVENIVDWCERLVKLEQEEFQANIEIPTNQ